ncbi:hypothetical protein BDY17DRAFT_86468 [Neohortaea acidophila]|uniref:Major facilitator superfamily (MFS) profile domain-containing protein n=1 Tax=Neohortaea acidophila TaxID=245834 RepID=A0A6A6Q4A1_9PEZI|nr:uncharacterized protein BDY17DRAFT_86468 [Neohortaea acidophila]KAF2486814.1 hypothetical protein BDY17DRAFT_86468 [Neohortaea acidophila]
MLFVALFFESICFPTIVALGMRGLGKHSKSGSGLIVAGVSGGAVVPPLLGVTADMRSTAFAMVVPLCFFLSAWTYPLAVNFIPRTASRPTSSRRLKSASSPLPTPKARKSVALQMMGRAATWRRARLSGWKTLQRGAIDHKDWTRGLSLGYGHSNHMHSR